MSNSYIGNRDNPLQFVTEWETEVSEDEYEDLWGEFVFETDITGFRAVCPKNSQTTTVTFNYYYYAPTSEWYWDYNYGEPYSSVIPLVYSCDSDWKLSECLNQSLVETSFTNQANGWKTLSVTLKRKLRQGEKIFCGLYADLLGFAVLDEVDFDTTSCYQYDSLERRRNYASQIAYITSANWFSKQRALISDYEVCLYIQYENEVESVAYTRTVLGNVGAATGNSRKVVWKRTLKPGGNISSSLSRKTVWKRNTSSSGMLSALSQRHNLLRRGRSSVFMINTENNNRIFFFRLLENISCLVSGSSRNCSMKIEKTDDVLSADNLNRHAFLKTSFSSDFEVFALCGRKNIQRRQNSAGAGFTDTHSKNLDYARMLETNGTVRTENYRALDMRVEKADSFSLSDAWNYFLRVIRSCFSYNNLLENQSHIVDYKRMPKSVVDDEESIIRWGDNFRSFSDDIEFEASPFASRLFFRTVQTVMSLWDWLRGKIREANNVVTLFCPIHLEIEMECRI